jgi:cytochrome c
MRQVGHAEPGAGRPDDFQRAAGGRAGAHRGADEGGEAKFALCASCHTITPGGPNMTGPNLHGVVGRKAGVEANYNYSDAVKTSGITWDAAKLDKWLADPRTDLPGTKMSFVGLKDPKDRTDVIAYLMVNSQ